LLKHEIQSVAFDPEGGLTINYYTPKIDIKEPGVAHLHTLVVPKGFDYDDEIANVFDAVHYLINDVLDDFDKLPGMDARAENSMP
jgi:hypothetical protein